jgi:hypothetical protein
MELPTEIIVMELAVREETMDFLTGVGPFINCGSTFDLKGLKKMEN